MTAGVTDFEDSIAQTHFDLGVDPDLEPKQAILMFTGSDVGGAVFAEWQNQWKQKYVAIETAAEVNLIVVA
jgi:hypothetical protein